MKDLLRDSLLSTMISSMVAFVCSFVVVVPASGAVPFSVLLLASFPRLLFERLSFKANRLIVFRCDFWRAGGRRCVAKY